MGELLVMGGFLGFHCITTEDVKKFFQVTGLFPVNWATTWTRLSRSKFPQCKVVLFARQIKLLLKIFAPSPRR